MNEFLQASVWVGAVLSLSWGAFTLVNTVGGLAGWVRNWEDRALCPASVYVLFVGQALLIVGCVGLAVSS